MFLLLLAASARAQTCGICTFQFGCTDRFSCNFDADADAPDPDNALCNYGPDINRDRVCDEFQTFADIICIDGQTDLVAPEGPIKAHAVQPGDVLTTPRGSTRVRRVRAYNQTHYPVHIEPGACDANREPVIVTEDHAVWCDGRWYAAAEIGTYSATPSQRQYVAIETEDYCGDRLLTSAGVALEGWDGRDKYNWRPHGYDAGKRVRCANRGTWWEFLLWAIDVTRRAAR